MAEYYLKVPHAIRAWYPGVAPGNWRECIFEDVTEQGSRLVLEHLPPNEEGERIALHGDRFFVQVGRDKDRFDALYVIRIEPAENNLPRSTPENVHCRITLWPGGIPPFKDPVAALFKKQWHSTGGADEDEDESSAEPTQPSPLLLSILPQAGSAVRQRFRPGHEAPEPGDALDFVQALSAAWRRRRLDQFITPTARQESLLKGVVKPSNLGRKERDGLLSLFGFTALNKAALQHRYDPERFFLILDDFGRLSLPAMVRAMLWTSMLEGLTSQALREELFAASDGLKKLAFEGVPAERAWEEGLLRALKEVAVKQNDFALREVAEKAEASEDPSAHIAAWASNLGFERPAPTVATAERTSVIDIVPSPPAAEVTSESHPADAWAFRTAGPDPATVEGIRQGVVKILESRGFLVRQVTDMSSLVSLIDALQQLREAAGSWLAELPDSEAANDHLAAAQQAYASVHEFFGDAKAALLDTLSPQDVAAVVELMENEATLRKMPAWLWSADSVNEEMVVGAARSDLALRLADPEVRRRVRSVLTMVDQLNETTVLNWLDPPTPGHDADAHIANWFERTRELLTSAPADVLHWLGSGQASLSDVADIERGLSLRVQLKGDLEPTVFGSLEAHLTAIESHAERRDWLDAYSNAVESYREQFGDPSDIGYAGLRRKAEKELRSSRKLPNSDEIDAGVAVEHNWTETTATKATLVFHQPDPGVDYGVLSAPVVLETRQPRQLDVALSIEVKGDHRNAWPKEWPDITPSGSFTVPAYGWQPQPETDRWQYPLALRIPIRKPRADLRLEVSIQVFDAHKGTVLGPKGTLRWESIELSMPRLELRWAGTTNPHYVRSHPIGPQAQVADIIARLRAGGSVAVIAPRRFGKSTLVEYLLNDGAESGLLVPPAIVCTEYATASGLDYDRLWASVSDWFYRHLDASLPPNHTGLLPDVNAFDQVRKGAHEQGFKAIVLLFDESQLFFPQAEGPALGTRLKNLLERHWSRSDTKGMVPVLFGFIGLPTLRERAGADLMGLLAPIERSVISEVDLRRLISGMTTGLQTTRAARARLAEVAGNLFILRVLLDRLIQRLRAESRVWASSDDVMTVERELKRELLAGREEDVARYIRDALNRAEKITDWDPIPAFGVAAALAEVRGEGRLQADGVSRLVQRLNDWCRLNAADGNVHAMYDPSTVERHLTQLRDRRVAKDLEFTSGLLEAWLQGVARHGAYPGFQAALLRGAQRRIELPPGAEQVARGGQAEIWRAAAPDGKGQIAYRVRQLASSAEEQQFQSTVEMFDVLRAGVLRREPGSDCLADVLDIGLSASDPTKAILVYRWIDGRDLSERVGQLPADIVVALGSQLCRALALIHSRNILHRDIRPANIVLDDSLMRPVLIDFGFARRVGVEMQTKLAGDYCAPEVRRDHPIWSKAADAYSLAATLRSLMRGDAEAPDLDDVLRKAMSDRPDDRPGAESFLESLEALERARQLETKRQDAWVAVRDAIETDRHKPWFSGVLHKFRPHFEAMALGFFPQPLQRYRQIADFLNQTLEAFPQAGLTLKRLSVEDPSNQSLAALVVVRNTDAHAGQALGREAREALQKFQSAGLDRQRALMIAGVEAVAAHLRLGSLPGLLTRYL